MSQLSAKDLTIRRDGRTILQNVTLSVLPGERIGVVGPNGVGKSTLLNALAGAIPVSSGSVASPNRLADRIRTTRVGGR